MSMRQVVVVPAGAVKVQVTVLDVPGDTGPPVMAGAGGAVRSSVKVLDPVGPTLPTLSMARTSRV